MYRLYLIALLLIGITKSDIKAQSSTLSFEFQAYPTGLIPGIRYAHALNDESALLLRVGYNWIRHRDLGVHDDERGDGYGFTLGYTRQFNKFDISLKNDLWWNTIDWKDVQDSGPDLNGTTNITVVQPTLEAVYKLSERINPSIAFGYEWNAKTKGEETGQGAILLIGCLINIL